MRRFRAVLGLIAGGFLILSAGAHSILGWRMIGGQLAQTNAPPDLVTSIKMGWIFGGPPMLVFGVLAIATFLKRFRGEQTSVFATSLIAVMYVAYGAWAAILTGGDPFFLMFVVPGALLGVASL